MSNETYVIKAVKRDLIGSAHMKKIRANGDVPAVLYGHNVEGMNLTVNAIELDKIFAKAGESTVIQVDVEGDVRNALIHAVTRNALGQMFTHVDFYQVNMNEKITAEVEVVFEGVAPAEKALGGVVMKNISHIAVHCLPKDLPHHIVVDLTKLATFDDMIRVSDLTVDAAVEIEHAMDDVVVSVAPPRSEAEMDALNTEVVADVDSVEVDGKKPEDAEAATDGAKEKAAK